MSRAWYSLCWSRRGIEAVLLVLIVCLTVWLLVRGPQVWDLLRQQQAGIGDDVRQQATIWLLDDLAAMQPAGEGVPGVTLQTNGTLGFAAARHQPLAARPDDLRWSEPVEVGYRWDQQTATVWRWVRPLAGPGREQPAVSNRLLGAVTAWRVRVQDGDGVWHDAWQSEQGVPAKVECVWEQQGHAGEPQQVVWSIPAGQTFVDAMTEEGSDELE